jgi:hypothetical protein
MPNIEYGGFEPNFKIKCKDALIYDFKQDEGKTQFYNQLTYTDLKIQKNSVLFWDDVKIEFYHINGVNIQVKAFHFWFNASFIDKSGILQLDKKMIDKAHKDKKCRKFDKNFRLEVYMNITKNFMIQTRDYGNGLVVDLPVEKMSENNKKLLEIATKVPKHERKISL